MKQRLIPLILILALLLSCMLAACGEKDNGASLDTAAITDESAAVETSAAMSAPSSNSASSASSEASSGVSSSAASSSAPASAPQQDDAVRQDDPDDSEQEAASVPQKSSQSSSKALSSGSVSSVSPNPAYGDDLPNFTIVLTNKAKKKDYSAACSYMKDNDNLAYASFFLPGGDYDIAVYEYADKIDIMNPLATSSYSNNIDESKRKSIQVYYTPDEKKIEVKESTSSRNQ